ncbi:ROK family protein [Thalassolituus marinus]|uniref:ROK family protein n=1 Tax=Thalassolituus marinus TaxID=671053 RepID=A0ABS7ZXQ6_9GAMM|nr:ROK family protein [Thalassolituus marinus]MCA6065165.1 ROK family protein [Thalassolituus marinus]
MLQFGIDLGGTKTEIIVLDQQGQQCLRRRVATPSDSYDAIVATICQLVNSAADELNCQDYSLGIGIPGAISPTTGLIKNANTTCLIGRDFKGDLEQVLQHPVTLANDADCLALSEATDGAGAGFPTVFCVIIGTGCGGGWVVNGQLISGPNAIAGEWGHNPLLWRDDNDGQHACYCGQQGCLETLLSGTGLRLQACKETAIDQPAQQWQVQAEAGDATALAVLERYYLRLAKALAGVINLMDPHVIVLGGGVSNLPGIYQAVPRLWQDYVFSDTVVTPLKAAQHGDSSGVRGAAWLGAAYCGSAAQRG